MMNKPELLAPAGGREALIAAVQNGADAVYLGTGGFNARQTADNFAGDALGQAVQYCHERGVRVFVTLNTMVRDGELRDLEAAVRQIASSHADAVLVQDFGVARLVRQIAPEIELHASTQMAVHNRAGALFLKHQGFSRVVLAREMDLSAIRECADLGVELEVFVHGALCVACSGQCLFSSLVGGRSGNRGRCAQPCRMRYRMDGMEGHLLSTRDLCSLNALKPLIDAGVNSFKIEGRLKRPEYVACVTRAYRAAIDAPEQMHDDMPLRQMFNRGGFTRGYVPGVDDAELMYAARPNHLGVDVGACVRDGQVRLSSDIDPSDVVALRRDERSEDRPAHLQGVSGETVRCAEARAGDRLVRLVSELQMRSERESFSQERRCIALTADLALHVGKPAALTVSDGTHEVRASGEIVESARTRGADAERVEAQLRKTGGTPYRFEDVRLSIDENAFAPLSVLNALRRDALERLTQLRLPAPYHLYEAQIPAIPPHDFPDVPRVCVQSASPEILRCAAALGADAVFSPEDVRADALLEATAKLPEAFALALPMALPEKTLEQLNVWARQNAGRIRETYVSNVAHFAFAWPGALVADFSLNAANRAAVLALRDWSCTRVTPSVELTAAQIEPLPGSRELIVHGRLPLMQLRHCPYRAAHALKGPHAACRRCDACAPQDRVGSHALTDRTGAAFPLARLATDEGCIVRVLNSVPLMTLRHIRRLPKCDVWRLLIDDMDSLKSFLPLYLAAASGEDVRAKLPNETSNTTTGHFFRGVE